MSRIALAFLLSSFVAAADEPSNRINIWYGPTQSFGHLGGHPQKWVNILGHLETDASTGIKELTFTLNDGSPQQLSYREDNKRIARDGDFNIEIDRADLNDGSNDVRVTATLDSGTVLSQNVTVEYAANASKWPLPYEIDWSKTKRIQDAAQVVDGRWEITKRGLRTVQRYYDRVIAFGDETWTDYEVETTVTVHAVTGPKEGGNITNVTHAAIALRWPGHDADGKQPSVKWYPVGATAEFRLGKRMKECRWRIFDGKRELLVESERRRKLFFGKPYHMKHRVETTPDGWSHYRAKLWRVGRREPKRWDLDRYERGDLKTGSALLIAHHADVTFGNVRARSTVEKTRADRDAAFKTGKAAMEKKFGEPIDDYHVKRTEHSINADGNEEWWFLLEPVRPLGVFGEDFSLLVEPETGRTQIFGGL